MSTITIGNHNNIAFEDPNIIAVEMRKNDVVMKVNLADLKKEIIASTIANARTQLLCLNTKKVFAKEK